MSASADRRIRLALGTWASAVFLALWVGAVANALGGGGLAADAWRWLGGLSTVGQIVIWALLLPIPVGLWASQASLSAAVGALVVLALVGWTAVAWVRLADDLRRRSARTG